MAEIDDFHLGSEEVYTNVCVGCEEENLYRKAAGYCKTCREYLCNLCIQHHQNVRMTKSHEIVNITDDIEGIASQLSGTSIEEDVCVEHGKHAIDMYCKTHSEVGCPLCMTLGHNKCSTEPIEAAFKRFNDRELENKLKEMEDILFNFERVKQVAVHGEEKAVEEFTSFLKKQEMQKEYLKQTIREKHSKEERIYSEKLGKYLNNSKQKIKTVDNNINATETLLRQYKEIHQAKSSKRNFIAWSKLTKQIALLERTLEDAKVEDRSIPVGSMTVDNVDLYVPNTFQCHKVMDGYKDFVKPSKFSKLEAPFGQDTMVKNGVTLNINARHQCLTAMKQYEDWSLEELRWQWYEELFRLNYREIIKQGLHAKKTVTGVAEKRYKVLLLGDRDVGKTTFIQRHISGNLSKTHKESLGASVHPITLWTTVGPILFDVWDTWGQERFTRLGDGFYKGGDCGIIMFDVSSDTSVNSVTRWFELVREHCGSIPVVVCGNRVDLATTTMKKNNVDQLRKLTLPCLTYQLMSGKTMSNFEAPFLSIARALLPNSHVDILTKCALYPVKKHDVDVKGQALPSASQPTRRSAQEEDNEDL